jgi:hypothetical protein
MTQVKSVGELLDVALTGLPPSGEAREAWLEVRNLLSRYGLQRLRKGGARCQVCQTDITLEALWRGAKKCDRCDEPQNHGRRQRVRVRAGR